MRAKDKQCGVHKAKGLEAPVVFLACPYGDKDHDADQFVDRSEAEAEGYFLIQQSKGFSQKRLPSRLAGMQ